jgi:hypothetical protein
MRVRRMIHCAPVLRGAKVDLQRRVLHRKAFAQHDDNAV